MSQHGKTTTSISMLCVDDKEELRVNLKQQFDAEDFQVDTAENGVQALEMISRKRYDIVLLDLKMPKMDGKGVLLELKKLQRIPKIVMLTGVDDVPTAQECVRLGAKDYIAKPYDPEELLHVVIKALGA